MTEQEAINVINYAARSVVTGIGLAFATVVGAWLLWLLFWEIRNHDRLACYIGLHNWGPNWGNTFGGKKGANVCGEGHFYGLYLQCGKCGKRRIVEPPEESSCVAYFYARMKDRKLWEEHERSRNTTWQDAQDYNKEAGHGV